MVFFSNMTLQNYLLFPFSACDSHLNFDTLYDNSIDIPLALATFQDTTISIDPINISYKVNLKNNTFTNKDTVIIICTRDLEDLLEFTIKKLLNSNVLDIADILIVDDRSKTDNILSLAKKYQLSYLRIDNSQNIFNYSNLNNLAVSYAAKYNKTNIIFWNNDLWPSSKDTLPNLINKHKNSNSCLSGTRLVYPSSVEYSIACANYDHIMGSNLQKYHLTIQHGGILFFPLKSILNTSGHCWKPFHAYRFSKYDEFLASQDTATHCVTGAMHITNTQDFIEVGGFNPSMSHTIQDIDLCLKYIKHQKRVMYLGSEYMFHAETITGHYNKVNNNIYHISDNILYEYLWMNSIKDLIGFGFLHE